MPTVRIIAINDVYSLANLPRLRTLVEHHRTNQPADLFLVTLAGDFVGPSILSSLDLASSPANRATSDAGSSAVATGGAKNDCAADQNGVVTNNSVHQRRQRMSVSRPIPRERAVWATRAAVTPCFMAVTTTITTPR